MSCTRFVELDSSYRDRTKYPNPGQFDVLITQKQENPNSITASDPVSEATPLVTYQMSNIRGTPKAILAAPATIVVTTSESSGVFMLPQAPIPASRINNYYRGIPITFKTGGTEPTTVIQTWTYITTVGTNDYFRVTWEPSIDISVLTVGTTIDFLTEPDYSQGLVFIPTGENTSDKYKGWYVYNETNMESAEIISYDGTWSLASILPQPSWNLTDVISIRKKLPLESSFFQLGSTTSSVVLSATSNTTTGYYNGIFLRITHPGSNNNQIRSIVSYTGSTFTATLNKPLPDAPSGGDTYEILEFTRDNAQPFDFIGGTQVSQDQYYEVRLANLILPNLNIEAGGLPTSYPYLYVDLQSYSSSGNGPTPIMSNNPNSMRRLFRAPVDEVTIPSINSFITLKPGYDMIQIVRMNPDSSLRFGVYLPDGTPYKTVLSDTTSPSEPHSYLQVSALFAFKKV